MFQLVYVSTETRPMTKQDLHDLLVQARKKNARLDITGMLLYRSGSFMQVLEGAEDAVRSLYTTIRADERHTGVITLMWRDMERREFPDWAMGFRDISGQDFDEVPGYTQFMEGGFERESFMELPSFAYDVLHYFKSVDEKRQPPRIS